MVDEASIPLFVFAADNHLAPRAWARHPELAGDSYYSLTQLVDYCEAKRLPLLLGGDFFDVAYPDPATFRRAVEELGRLPAENNWFVQGQHELQRQTPWLSVAALLGDNLRHAHGQIFCPCPETAPDFRVYGLDWQPAAALAEALAALPEGADALLAHQVWSGLMPRGACEAELTAIPKVRYLFTGDYHVHKAFPVSGADGQRLVVVSAGSQCMQAIDEHGDKYFWVFHADGTLLSVPLVTRRVYRFALRSAESFAAAVEAVVAQVAASEELPEEVSAPIVEVRFAAGIDRAAQILQESLGHKVHLFLQPLPESGKVEPVRQEEAARLAAAGLEGQLPECCGDAEVLSTCLRLLRSRRPPRQEAQAVIQERLEVPRAPASTTLA